MHGKHLDKMLGLWNQQNPDKQIKLNVTVMPYDDMHNKLLLAVTSGKGAPDIADIELGQFPKFLEGDNVPLESLNDVFAPYKDVVVPSRVEIYSKADQVYGFDYHVGATLAFTTLKFSSKQVLTTRQSKRGKITNKQVSRFMKRLAST